MYKTEDTLKTRVLLIGLLLIFVLVAAACDKSPQRTEKKEPVLPDLQKATQFGELYALATGDAYLVANEGIFYISNGEAVRLSTVTVDNRQNDSDVFVKLVSLDGTQAYPIRQFYIPAYGSFTLKKVRAGSYDIRYRDLNNGSLSRSETFSLGEMSTSNGKQYSNITMTLYKVQNGNMQTYGLSETEL